MFKQKSKEKGITIITLVVTIIILIILASININTLIGNNGIITKAQQAKENIELAQIEEQSYLNQLYKEMYQEGIYAEELIQKDEIIKELQERIKNLENQLKIYELKEGDYIKYDTGVEGVGVITCRVLYTASSKYGLQIISEKDVEMVLLGISDNFEQSKTSYNHAIETLNNTAEKYINSNYSTDARCVGSVPTVENGMFINKNSETQGPVTMQFEYNGSTNFRMLLVVV